MLAAGQPIGVADRSACSRSTALRIEKGYRAWKGDLSTDYSLFEGGLDRFVKLDKPQDFPGKTALLNQKQQGVAKRFVTLTVDAGDYDAPYMSTLWKGDQIVGETTSGAWGYRVGKSVALGMLRTDLAHAGEEVEVDIYGDRRRAVVQPDGPLWDPGQRKTARVNPSESRAVVLLDGGMGQELLRRSSKNEHPIWSATVMLEEPDIVRAVHEDYIRAGAKVVTINSYAVSRPRFEQFGLSDDFAPIQQAAIALATEAREAAEGDGVSIAGCLSPLTGSYRTDLAFPYAQCVDYYREMVDLQAPHVDLF